MRATFTLNITADHDKLFEATTELDFKVRHIRNRSNPSYGGATIISYVFRGEPQLLTSKCHPADRFSKRGGIVCCLQKWVDINYPGLRIIAFTAPNKSNKDVFHIHISDMPMEKYWWTK